jgi:hypothetical protein
VLRRGPTPPAAGGNHRVDLARAALSAHALFQKVGRQPTGPGSSPESGGRAGLRSVSAGVAAPSTDETNPDTASGSARPAGVDTNNTSAINANTTAPPATRAFAQITDPRIANKINAPTLCTGSSPVRAHDGEGSRARRSHECAGPARGE